MSTWLAASASPSDSRDNVKYHVLAFGAVCFAISACASSKATAQSPSPSLRNTFSAAQQNNQLLRVHFHSGDSASGRVRSIVGDSLVLLGDHEVRFANVRTIERRIIAGDPAKDGLVFGLAIGAATCLAAALVFPVLGDVATAHDSSTQGALTVATGALIGAGVGFLLDSARGRRISWAEIWP
jgi:hypothetical protein